jgi:hypothetical protein
MNLKESMGVVVRWLVNFVMGKLEGVVQRWRSGDSLYRPSLVGMRALLKLFSFKVTREGLSFPVNFDKTVGYALKRIGEVLREVTGVLVERHAIDRGSFLQFWTSMGCGGVEV